MIKLAYWMKTNYGSTINQALKTVIPVKEKVKQVNNRTVRLLISPREALSLSEEYRTSKRKQSEILKFCPIIRYVITGRLHNRWDRSGSH